MRMALLSTQHSARFKVGQLRRGGGRTCSRMQLPLALGQRRWATPPPAWAEGHNGAVRIRGPAGKTRPHAIAAAGGVESAGAARIDTAARDDDLVLLLPAHDERAQEALAALYDRYSSAVYGLALRMLGDAGLAEDVLQETFWRLWQHAGQYEPGRVRFATWLFRVASNLAIGEIRRASRRPRTALPRETERGGSDVDPLAGLLDPDPEVPDQVWLAEQRRAVQAGLGTLPPEQRQALELAYFGGLTHAEIAAMQAAPLSTVKTRLALGLRKLAGFLRERRAVDEERAP
jgi:RNA polymerase sigma-70 factor (ECF subfamily)